MRSHFFSWLFIITFCIYSLFSGFPVNAANTSNFTQVINPGTLSVDIVDGSFVSVPSPSVAFTAVPFSFGCQQATGTFGNATQRIYVQNPDASDSGWTVSLAGSATTALWDSAGIDYDFNDPTGSGCTDGADADARGGQMGVDPSVSTLTVGQCSTCTVNNVSKGSSSAFEEGSVNNITILTGAAGSDDLGDWLLTDVAVTQEIPGEQPAAADYDITMVLSIVAI